MPLCGDCGYHHDDWLTCYSAAKGRWEAANGKQFWTGESITEYEIDCLRKWFPEQGESAQTTDELTTIPPTGQLNT